MTLVFGSGLGCRLENVQHAGALVRKGMRSILGECSFSQRSPSVRAGPSFF